MTRSRNAWRQARRCGLFVAILAFGLGAAVHAADLKAPQSPFTADLKMKAGDVTMDGKLWYDGGLERREMTMQGQHMIVLVRPDQNAIFMISGEEKTAMEMPLTPELRYFNEEALADLNPKVVGRETIAGESTNKYSLDGVSKAGGRMEGQLWMTSDFIVMKMEGRAQLQGEWQDMQLSLENLKRGSVDPKLFELPAGYEVRNLN